MEIKIDPSESPFAKSPVVPEMVDGSHVLNFRCYPGISCWNACCANIDITLTPYDILRLKNRLEISSGEFLKEYTIPYEIDREDLPGVKFRPVEGGTACRFMRPEGCSVYEDRPTACRYYPVAQLALRKQDEYVDGLSFALVKEDHCLGHQDPRSLTVDEYRLEQGVADYDELSRGWRQLILKKRSSGPTVGKPTKRSLQLFFMACYDVDRFRAFVLSPGFHEVYDLPVEELEKVAADDTEAMLFGLRFLKQVMFGEESIPMRADALDRRLARRGEEGQAEGEAAPE